MVHIVSPHLFFLGFGRKLSPRLKMNETYGIKITELAQYDKKIKRETLDLLINADQSKALKKDDLMTVRDCLKLFITSR